MIPKDKLLHIALGVLWLCNTLVNLWVLIAFGIGPAAAYGTTTYAILYEVNQWYRKEGNPEFWDAFCTSLPGWVFWAFVGSR